MPSAPEISCRNRLHRYFRNKIYLFSPCRDGAVDFKAGRYNCSMLFLFRDHSFLSLSEGNFILFGVFLYLVLFFFSGTGSYPPLEKGLHRSILHTVSAVPLIAPKRSIACIPYTEHTG